MSLLLRPDEDVGFSRDTVKSEENEARVSQVESSQLSAVEHANCGCGTSCALSPSETVLEDVHWTELLGSQTAQRVLTALVKASVVVLALSEGRVVLERVVRVRTG